jgi:uncharacterized protein with NAD-binding domain and iron-sulfur cluster
MCESGAKRVTHTYDHLMKTVAVLGGGVAGLSAAHELVERGFAVTVYEGRDSFGGKARSIPVPGSAVGNRNDLPGEHGFRFFPGFYRHLPDTMARIPTHSGTVADNLVAATHILMAQDHGRNEVIAPAGVMPRSIDDIRPIARFLWQSGRELGLAGADIAHFANKMFGLLGSCEERRFQQLENTSWWEFFDAESRSPAFRRTLGDGLTRMLVAARAREVSARTGGQILCQLLFDTIRVGGQLDRVLNGPTSEAWIHPWENHLQSLGVTLRNNCKVAGLSCDGRRITGAAVASSTGTEVVTADFYVAALPVEQLRPLVSRELSEAEPRLRALSRLTVRWMNGVMFYLDHDVPLERGHAIFIDSEWALTAISQAQFWPTVNLEERGDGRVQGILSIVVSEWDRPGRRTGKVAMACSRDEIRQEVWGQIADHMDDASLVESNVLSWFLDPSIEFPNPTAACNLEPLLVNTVGSWADRPDAVTQIENLFIASDFVRTHTDLATMEGANEAARRAVNGILAAVGAEPDCKIWRLSEPALFAPFKALDKLRWKLHRPSKAPFEVSDTGKLVAGPIANRLLKSDRAASTMGPHS